ncbi:hypothetical protein ACFC36_33945 [Streptomyces rubiginosohelvolus]|uniref:hypothetical protein n=1 Tax=Streptomyces rubiginosohelvolus TaxID=67362 RepID=UPI0035E35315
MARTPVLSTSDVTVTTDNSGRLYAIVPDEIARRLNAASREGIDPNARGAFFRSVTHPADSWTATTVRTVFESVLSARPEMGQDLSSGLGLYRTHDGGDFRGFIVGESAWDSATRWWREYGQHDDLITQGAAIATRGCGSRAGTCTFGD